MPTEVPFGNGPESNRRAVASDDAGKNTYMTTVRDHSFFAKPQSIQVETTKPYLMVLSGRDQGKRFELSKQVNRFGRSRNADIVLLDPKMSRNHGQLTVLPDRVVIEDYDSTNGTYVDGLKIEKKAIDTKSRIRVGNTIMKIDHKNPHEARFEDTLYRAAHSDPLTGLLNRRAFMEHAREEIDLCRQNELPLVIGMCDVDYFKQINDTHGHPAGDYVLQQIARLINESLRIEDPVGRYGGEEFIFLFRGFDAPNAKERSEKIRTAVEAHECEFQGRKIPCTISIGICCRQAKKLPTLEKFIQSADDALMSAKRRGRNRIEVA